MSPTRLMIRDELIGFARSRVMIVLWALLPALALVGYALISSSTGLRSAMAGGAQASRPSATAFVSLMISSIAGTVAALMVAVDVVSERQRKVYELFVIRPMRRDTILTAKFVAVFACVSLACVIAIGLGLGVDALQGDRFDLHDVAKGLSLTLGVVALSAAVGIFFGVASQSILVAVILVQFVGQTLVLVPMIPALFGLPDAHWMVMAITAVLVALVMTASLALFRKSEF